MTKRLARKRDPLGSKDSIYQDISIANWRVLENKIISRYSFSGWARASELQPYHTTQYTGLNHVFSTRLQPGNQSRRNDA